MTNNNPEIVFMVGLPGVGKSTYSAAHYAGYQVISSDRYIEEYALEVNKTYNDVFNEYVNIAEKMFKEELKQAIKDGKNIVIDRTNMTVKSRNKLLSIIPKSYKKTAICFEINNTEEHKRRLDSRPNKVIQSFVLTMLNKNYVKPSHEEGFDEIKTITI